jgi:hypothetical protein
MNRFRLLLFFALALGLLLHATTARAQYELKAGNFNSTFVAQTQAGASATPSGPPNVGTPPPTASQFSGMGSVAGSAGPISTSTTLADRFPSNPDNTLVLMRASFGSAFAAGVPRLFMGDEITPPLVQADGATPAAANYWRAKPVLPGESFSPLALPVTVLTSSTGSPTVTLSTVPASLVAGSALLGRTVGSISTNTITLSGGNANQTITAATIVTYVAPGVQTPLPLGTVNVIASSTTGADNRRVIVASAPPELVVGATLLGQPITRVTGTTVTLAGPANTTITSSTPASITPATTFYYSVHAEKTYASQPGRVAIIWVTRVPNGSGNYEIASEDFAVSSNTTLPVRTIFWTEGSFDGPKVQITDARITTVNPAFYSQVPKAVAEEVAIPGYVPLTPNLSTLSFDRFNGIGNLHAYNVEGRVVIEYLGNVRLAGVIHESVGIDVLDIKRVPDVAYPVVHLGSELRPHDGDPSLRASPVLSTSQTGASFYGTVVKPDNTNAYYAERETSAPNDPDNGIPASIDAYNKVVFYWMQTGTFGIQWPKFQDRYWQRWSPNLADYAHYTVDPAGSTPATGIAFTGGSVPQLVHQDDPAQIEARIDLATQRLFVDLSASSDKRNRSLLKFDGNGKVWYVNVYTQAESRVKELVSTSNSTITTVVTVPSTASLTVGMTVTGPGITGSATILQILSETQFVLSQNIPDATNALTYGTPVSLQSTSSRTVVTHAVNDNAVYEDDEVRTQDGNFRGKILKKLDSTRFIISRNTLTPFDYISNGTRLFNAHYPNGTLWESNWSLTTSNLAPNSVTVPNTAALVTGMTVTGPGITGSASISSITDATHYVLSTNIPDARNNLTYSLILNSVSQTTQTPTEVTVASTVGLEVGMIVSGPGITGVVSIAEILSSTQLRLSQSIPNGASTLAFTVQSDAGAPIATTATVGTRLAPPAGHELAGFISGGACYYPAGYLNPFGVGVTAANAGAIIPVNARPADNQLTVRWFKKVAAPTADFQDFYVPGKVGRYTVSYPAPAVGDGNAHITIAGGVGTGDLAEPERSGSIYYQNNSAQPGFNPNEEHALMLGGRAYALRDDLNTAATSEPFVLLAYTAADARPAIRVWKVRRIYDPNGNSIKDSGDILFDYDATAGTLLVKPYPLPLLPLPMVGTGVNRTSKDIEITGADNPASATLNNDSAYTGFTFKDRKGFTWVHRGAHGGGSGTLTMKLYYLSQAGFFVPGIGEPAVGTVLPFLRDAIRTGTALNINAIDNGQTDQPLPVIYRPSWPTNAPELLVAETLTLPKFGLPAVRGQASAQVLYQQSIAQTASNPLTKNSVTLHDPTREKTVALGVPGLDKVPAVIRTTSYQGRTYFQGLPPSLQTRIYFDPLRGAKGTLVLLGEFHDEAAGEDYLDLGLLTGAEETMVKTLVPAGNADKSKWDAAIEALAAKVETFVPDPAQFGTYKVGSTATVGENELAVISAPDAAVESYALTATGQGAGYVTMVFGNGRAFTPEGDPVQVKVFKIAQQLYTGDLKVVSSANPLDEQTTLRHSADFAGMPEDYEFEWRWATGEASAPATYANLMTKRIGDPTATTHNWFVVRDPGAVTPSAAQVTAAQVEGSASFPRSENVRPVNYILNAQGQPTATVIDATSYTDSDMAAGFPSLFARSSVGVDFTSGVPGYIVFSADLGTLDGCVLYVNGQPALAHNAPQSFFTNTDATTGLTANGLSRQFSIAPSYFTAGANTIEVAVYTQADPNVSSLLNFMIEAAQETDLVIGPGSVWQVPGGQVTETTYPYGPNVTVGGAVGDPFGGPQFVLNDRWFTMRYRPKVSANNVLGVPWSRWMPPQFVEGWIKRVLAAINPFEQRVKDLYNNSVNTDVSVITQAGKRWEGDVALTLDSINDAGLIEIYETVLNRARAMSIDANTNDPDTNNALLLAAGYLNDLYTILGNEAYADAANPTISLDDQNEVTEVSTSRFSFEGQVASAVDEELALLKGRDDFVSPGVITAPAYNRLYWNYTHGINGGEVIYAVNYNIKEVVGSSTANGVIDEYDAQRMYPQGHGDAYGHYLTALTGYYRLLANPNFTWTPRAEAVTVLGQPVTVDFQDERKFAAAAGNLARTAQQVVALTYRNNYKDDPAAGWSHYRDSRGQNPNTGVMSRQGLDEWVSRSAQGALYHWAVANALVPDEDPYHTGVQKIDRTTVPELPELVTAAASFQSTIDNANARLNPLGLSPGALAFDISPAEMAGGRSHFEQIYDRALQSLVNAAGAFNQAARMTRSLRYQQNQIDDYSTVITQQESAYVNELVDIFGRPYSGEIGPGKLYAQGYDGPDLLHWFIADRPNDIEDTGKEFVITIKEANEIKYFTEDKLADVMKGYEAGTTTTVTTKTVTVAPSQWVQYNDVWKPGGLGARAETGELQNALQDAQQSWLALSGFNGDFQVELEELRHRFAVFNDMVASHKQMLSDTNTTNASILTLERTALGFRRAANIYDEASQTAMDTGGAIAEYFPKVVGVAADATSPARGSALAVGIAAATVLRTASITTNSLAGDKDIEVIGEQQELDRLLTEAGFKLEEKQAAYEFGILYRQVTSHANELMQLTLAHQQALQNVNNVLNKGLRILESREVFRQRAAAIIQGYRTKDLTFRIFRNEALEQYRSLFDLASRYTYLTAKSYDYETGLLGTIAGQTVFSDIVASRSLGDVTAGTPISTVSSLGDDGLAGVMARLNADFSVVEGRLGINNPDQNGTVFSLRGELFRLLNDETITSDDDAWQQTLEQHMVSNVLNDTDVATYCMNIRKPDGTPVPGIILPFGSSIEHGRNFFGLVSAPGDHNFSPSSFATKIYSVGVALPGYVGMDSYAAGNPNGAPKTNAPNALNGTPYCYLIPCGNDYMRAPPLGDTNVIRSWSVQDQALPLPFNLGATDFNSTQFFNANGTLSEQPWIIRKHQAFRPVDDPTFYYGSVPQEFTSTRLIGRSVWNGRWKIVIPAYTLLGNEQEGLNRFAASVQGVLLFLRTYSHSGN